MTEYEDDDAIEQQLDWLDECEEQESKLTEWERGFIESLRVQLGNERPLTEKQLSTLEGIWKKI
jgi:hypothetical protein